VPNISGGITWGCALTRHCSRQLHARNVTVATQQRRGEGVHLRGQGHRLTDAVLLVPVQLVAGVAVALEPTQGVLTAVLAAATVRTAFIYVWESRGRTRGARL